MTWTKEKPNQPGWYWYRQTGVNLDVSMPAWVFKSGGSRRIYASLFAVNESVDFRNVKNIDEYRGEWSGPFEPPP